MKDGKEKNLLDSCSTLEEPRALEILIEKRLNIEDRYVAGEKLA